MTGFVHRVGEGTRAGAEDDRLAHIQSANLKDRSTIFDVGGTGAFGVGWEWVSLIALFREVNHDADVRTRCKAEP
jgi:hypothetical protein